MCKYLMYNIRNPVCFYSGWIDPLWDESFELISGPFLQMGCSIPQTRLWCWTVILRWSLKKRCFPFYVWSTSKWYFCIFYQQRIPFDACLLYVCVFLSIYTCHFLLLTKGWNRQSLRFVRSLDMRSHGNGIVLLDWQPLLEGGEKIEQRLTFSSRWHECVSVCKTDRESERVKECV